jgi:hypothetical protein
MTIYHIVPSDDLREHITDAGKTCWCHPVEDEDMIVHNSLDGREPFETGERRVS